MNVILFGHEQEWQWISLENITLHWRNQTSKTHVVWCHSDEVSGTFLFIETERNFGFQGLGDSGVGVRGAGREWRMLWEHTAFPLGVWKYSEIRVQWWYRNLWIYEKSQNCTFKKWHYGVWIKCLKCVSFKKGTPIRGSPVRHNRTMSPGLYTGWNYTKNHINSGDVLSGEMSSANVPKVQKQHMERVGNCVLRGLCSMGTVYYGNSLEELLTLGI